MSAPTHRPTIRSTGAGKRLISIVAALAALTGVFFLGRRTGGPEVPAALSQGDKSAAGGEKKEAAPAEKGVIKLDEEGLRTADLRVEPVAVRSLVSRLAVNGSVEPNLGGVVNVTPRVAGKITSVLVNVGDSVRQGQPLANLASTELATAQAQYRQAGARVAVAQNNLQRQRRLAATGEFGRPKVEEARRGQTAARGEVNAAQTELSAARTAIAEARSEKAAAEGEVAAAESEVANAASEATSAESEIAEAQSQVRALEAALEQAQTQVTVAQSKFNRYDTLLKEQLVSRQDWEQAQADARRSSSDVEAARANIAQGQAKVRTARAHLQAAQAKVRTMQAKVTAERGRAQQAAAKIETAQAREEQAKARLETARQQGEIAGQTLAREERIFRGGYLTSREIVEAEAGLRQARAEQQAAADSIRLMGGTPGGSNVLTVFAPIAGRVTARTVTLGETVATDKTLFTVINLNSVWVQLSIYPKDLPFVRVGQRVMVTTDTAPGRTFNGSLSYVGDAVDPSTRTVKVRAVIQNPGNVLKPQTFVRGMIAAPVRAQALSVPRDAVQEMAEKKVVFVQGDHPGEFRPKPVETGDTVSGQTVITSGIQPGDRVVVQGAFLVKAQAMKSELTEE